MSNEQSIKECLNQLNSLSKGLGNLTQPSQIKTANLYVEAVRNLAHLMGNLDHAKYQEADTKLNQGDYQQIWEKFNFISDSVGARKYLKNLDPETLAEQVNATVKGLQEKLNSISPLTSEVENRKTGTNKTLRKVTKERFYNYLTKAKKETEATPADSAKIPSTETTPPSSTETGSNQPYRKPPGTGASTFTEAVNQNPEKYAGVIDAVTKETGILINSTEDPSNLTKSDFVEATKRGVKRVFRDELPDSEINSVAEKIVAAEVSQNQPTRQTPNQPTTETPSHIPQTEPDRAQIGQEQEITTDDGQTQRPTSPHTDTRPQSSSDTSEDQPQTTSPDNQPETPPNQEQTPTSTSGDEVFIYQSDQPQDASLDESPPDTSEQPEGQPSDQGRPGVIGTTAAAILTFPEAAIQAARLDQNNDSTNTINPVVEEIKQEVKHSLENTPLTLTQENVSQLSSITGKAPDDLFSQTTIDHPDGSSTEVTTLNSDTVDTLTNRPEFNQAIEDQVTQRAAETILEDLSVTKPNIPTGFVPESTSPPNLVQTGATPQSTQPGHHPDQAGLTSLDQFFADLGLPNPVDSNSIDESIANNLKTPQFSEEFKPVQTRQLSPEEYSEMVNKVKDYVRSQPKFDRAIELIQNHLTESGIITISTTTTISSGSSQAHQSTSQPTRQGFGGASGGFSQGGSSGGKHDPGFETSDQGGQSTGFDVPGLEKGLHQAGKGVFNDLGNFARNFLNPGSVRFLTTTLFGEKAAILIIIIFLLIVILLPGPNLANYDQRVTGNSFYSTNKYVNIYEGDCYADADSVLPSTENLENQSGDLTAPTKNLVIDNDGYANLDTNPNTTDIAEKCFQYTVEININQNFDLEELLDKHGVNPETVDIALEIEPNSPSDVFEFITHEDSFPGPDQPDILGNQVPGFVPGPPFSDPNDRQSITYQLNSENTPTLYFTYLVDFSAPEIIGPTDPNFEDVAILNDFRLNVSVINRNDGQNFTLLSRELIGINNAQAQILIGDAPIINTNLNTEAPGKIDAYGSCPILSPNISLGSYTANSPSIRSDDVGHGGASYDYDFSIPVNGMYVPACRPSTSNPRNSLCPYYGFALDLTDTNGDTSVRLPNICPESCGSCTDLNWTVSNRWQNCQGDDEEIGTSCGSRENWGYGVILNSTGNCGHTYKIYLNHLSSFSNKNMYAAGEGLGYYCDGSTNGCTANHLHIELNIDETPQRPEDIMCNQ